MSARLPAAILLSALALACTPDGAEGDTTPDGPVPTDGLVVMATLSSDYAAGALTTVDRSTWQVHPDHATVHADAVVQAEADGTVWVINRLLMDTVRRYAPGALDVPVWETSTEPGSNPHALAMCGDDRVVVTRYEHADAWLLDEATGERVGTIDLSAEADADGLPEMSDVVVVDGVPWVALQRLRRDQGWTTAPTGGRVVPLDCDAGTAGPGIAVGDNPGLVADPSHPGRLWAVSTDGAWAVDTEDRTVSPGPPLRPSEGELVDLAVDAEGRAAMLVRRGAEHGVACGGVPGETGESVLEPVGWWSNYLSDVVVADGLAWVAVRQGWEDPSSVGGLMVVDLDTCEELTADEGWLQPALAPYDLAIVP